MVRTASPETAPLDVDGLWETYHHIRKLSEMGSDEHGNTWNQLTWGWPVRDDGDSIAPQNREYFSASELCGTGMCFAGWYCYLKGLKMNGYGYAADSYGSRIPIGVYVMRASGLVNRGAIPLFSPSNDLPRIAEILIRCTGEDRR